MPKYFSALLFPIYIHFQLDPHQSIIQWKDFSVSVGELEKIIQPHSKAAVLNQVIGLRPVLC